MVTKHPAGNRGRGPSSPTDENETANGRLCSKSRLEDHEFYRQRRLPPGICHACSLVRPIEKASYSHTKDTAVVSQLGDFKFVRYNHPPFQPQQRQLWQRPPTPLECLLGDGDLEHMAREGHGCDPRIARE